VTINLRAAIETLYALNTGVIGTGQDRHERPHKPIMLLAALDAVAAGKATPHQIPWTQWLRERFSEYFGIARSRNDDCSPENPFLYLKTDGLWHAVILASYGEAALTGPPLARDVDTGRVFARLQGEWPAFFGNPLQRIELREALVARYFPHVRNEIVRLFLEPGVDLNIPHTVREEEPSEGLPGRSAAFRKSVVELYDYQCAACGLRIWLSDHNLTFVDAAHLIPFSDSRNDHPTNGLALCKNHHWALDQRLIAPDPSGSWTVSRHIDARRSRGEEELRSLSGKPLLTPKDEAFRPAREGIEWRFVRLRN
jgi:putative restriction endonuclease